MILYTGTAPPPPSELDPLAPMQPHTFAKTVLEERTRRPAPSVIQQLPPALTPASNSDAIRTSLAHYARTVLAPYYERVTSSNRLWAYGGEIFYAPSASKICLPHISTTTCKGNVHGLMSKLNIYTKI